VVAVTADLLDTAAVAELLNISPATVRSYKNRGYLPAPDHVIQGNPAWWRTTIEKWVHNRPGQGRRRRGLAVKTWSVEVLGVSHEVYLVDADTEAEARDWHNWLDKPVSTEITDTVVTRVNLEDEWE
jgi:predicted DNA-binding transcriptional regulator AlpA